MASIIKKNTKLVEDCRVLLCESSAERGLVEDKLGGQESCSLIDKQ